MVCGFENVRNQTFGIDFGYTLKPFVLKVIPYPT